MQRWIKHIHRPIGIVALVLLLACIRATLLPAFEQQNFRMDQESEGLWKLLVGLLGIVLIITGTAWINYRFAYRHWVEATRQYGFYVAWMAVCAWLLFHLLEYRTDADPDFTDENWLVTGSVLLFWTVYAWIADVRTMQRNHRHLQQQHTAAELNALKAQINPHFLFNALNTIYNEAEKTESGQVADMIQQLAAIMRFLLQEAAQTTIPVEKELYFLDKYLALQKARLPIGKNLVVETDIQWDGIQAAIAPLLLIPFIENAFQHGISFSVPSHVDIRLRVEEKQLRLNVSNTIAPNSKKGNGVGLLNTQNRLQLMYKGQHQLIIKKGNNYFYVELFIYLT